jgi:hypothetical protein
MPYTLFETGAYVCVGNTSTHVQRWREWTLASSTWCKILSWEKKKKSFRKREGKRKIKGKRERILWEGGKCDKMR